MNHPVKKVDDAFEYDEPAAVIQTRLRPLTAAEFLSLEIPPRKLILDPWLPEKGLAMLVAPRGIGKTLFALSVAYAAACGGNFLGFNAPTPRRVFYLDGEMPARTMQERMASIIQGFEPQPPSPDFFRILTADLTEDGLPNLSTVEGQNEIDAQIGEAELIILDNLSTLVRSGKENEAESWVPIQSWILSHRRAGRSVLLIHHAGKNGTPRGTSKREDVLDTVISLRRPQDYSPDQGARFEIHFEKARGFFGDSAQPFEAAYEVIGDAAVWSHKTIDDVEMMRVVDSLQAGLSIREIGADLKLSKSKVQRLKDKAIGKGVYDAK
jgi:putative DNA primase/helicase